MKKRLLRNPPSLQELTMLEPMEKMGPDPIKGMIFQQKRIATMQVGHILMSLCTISPMYFLKKRLESSLSSIPIVSRKPPIQKNTSTAQQAETTRVGIPGAWSISMVLTQLRIERTLIQLPWPKTTQNMQRTLRPLMKVRFEFSGSLKLIILLKFCLKLKHLTIQPNFDFPSIPPRNEANTESAISPATKMTANTREPVQVGQLPASKKITQGTTSLEVLNIFWKDQLRILAMGPLQFLFRKSAVQVFGKQAPQYMFPRKLLTMSIEQYFLEEFF